MTRDEHRRDSYVANLRVVTDDGIGYAATSPPRRCRKRPNLRIVFLVAVAASIIVIGGASLVLTQKGDSDVPTRLYGIDYTYLGDMPYKAEGWWWAEWCEVHAQSMWGFDDDHTIRMWAAWSVDRISDGADVYRLVVDGTQGWSVQFVVKDPLNSQVFSGYFNYRYETGFYSSNPDNYLYADLTGHMAGTYSLENHWYTWSDSGSYTLVWTQFESMTYVPIPEMPTVVLPVIGLMTLFVAVSLWSKKDRA